ncbi:unnamed protein product, partial [Prorocentrum cordatum]
MSRDKTVSISILGNAHPDKAIPMGRGCLGSHTAATKERLVFCLDRAAPRHAPLPEDCEPEARDDGRAWLPLTAQQAAVYGWDRFKDDPAAAIRAGLQVDDRSQPAPCEGGLVIQGPPGGCVVSFPDGRQSRLRYLCRPDGGLVAAEYCVSSRWNLPDPADRIRAAARRIAELFNDKPRAVLEFEGRAKFAGPLAVLEYGGGAPLPEGRDVVLITEDRVETAWRLVNTSLLLREAWRAAPPVEDDLAAPGLGLADAIRGDYQPGLYATALPTQLLPFPAPELAGGAGGSPADPLPPADDEEDGAELASRGDGAGGGPRGAPPGRAGSEGSQPAESPRSPRPEGEEGGQEAALADLARARAEGEGQPPQQQQRQAPPLAAAASPPAAAASAPAPGTGEETAPSPLAAPLCWGGVDTEANFDKVGLGPNSGMIFSVDPGATTPFLDRAFVRQCLLSGAARAKLGSLVGNYSVASCDPGEGAENAARKRKKR